MGLSINTNSASTAASNQLSSTKANLDKTLQRLSTGKKLNSAKDDAAGLAVSEGIRSQTNGLRVARKNAGDAITMSQLAEGAMREIGDMVQRMRELAVSAANGTFSSSQRSNLNAEYQQLSQEITRIAESTTFNGLEIINGDISNTAFQVGEGSDTGVNTISASFGRMKSSDMGAYITELGVTSTSTGAALLNVSGGSSAILEQDLTFTTVSTGETSTVSIANGESAASIVDKINSNVTGSNAVAETKLKMSGLSTNFSGELSFEIQTSDMSSAVTISGIGSYAELTSALNAVSGTTGVTAELTDAGSSVTLTQADGHTVYLLNFAEDTVGNDTLSVTDINNGLSAVTLTEGGAICAEVTGSISIKADEQFLVRSSVDDTSGGLTKTIADDDIGNDTAITISDTNLSTAAKALEAITSLDGAINTISSRRATIGAVVNRMENVVEFQNSALEGYENAMSAIVDADVAEEAANLAKFNILMQAGSAVLGQANHAGDGLVQLIG